MFRIISKSGIRYIVLYFLIVTESRLNSFFKFSTDFRLAILLCRSWTFLCNEWVFLFIMGRRTFYIRIIVFWVWNFSWGMWNTDDCSFFYFDSLALLHHELTKKFITSSIARYSLQQKKPVVRKLLYNLKKREHFRNILNCIVWNLVKNVNQLAFTCSKSKIQTKV